MTTIRIIRLVAGVVILIACALGMEISPFYIDSNWLWLNVFVGFNLFQSGVTNLCPLEVVLKAGGYDEVAAIQK